MITNNNSFIDDVVIVVEYYEWAHRHDGAGDDEVRASGRLGTSGAWGPFASVVLINTLLPQSSPLLPSIFLSCSQSFLSRLTSLKKPSLLSPHLTSSHLTSPHLTSPHLTSPHLTSHHITSHHITSPHLTSPHLTSPHLTSPPLTSSDLLSTLLIPECGWGVDSDLDSERYWLLV